MTDERYQELLGRALDDEITPAESEELRRELPTDSQRLADFQFHLVLWDLFSQQRRPERSAEAFVGAWRTRLVAEQQGSAFVQSTMERLQTALEPGLPAVTGPDRNASDHTGFARRRTPAEGRSATIFELLRNAFARRWAVGMALAASVILTGFLCFWWWGPTTGQLMLAGVHGDGLSLKREGQLIPAASGMRLFPGDRLLTGAGTEAEVSFGPELTRIALHPGSDLTVTSYSARKRLVLRAGGLEALVAHQRLLRPMVIVTPHARVTVVGTEFNLLAATNETRVEVFAGIVRFAKMESGQEVPVPAGSFATTATGASFATKPISGKLLREVWLDLPGDTLKDLTYNARYPNAPSRHYFPSDFETDTNWTTAFGTRTRGYLMAPTKGDYDFHISGLGQMNLWLSPDEDPVGKVKIAQIVFTRNRPGNPPASQTRSQENSGPISLEPGQRYYIEALHKYGDGQDRLTITWKRPDGTVEPIPEEFLAPFNPEARKKSR